MNQIASESSHTLLDNVVVETLVRGNNKTDLDQFLNERDWQLFLIQWLRLRFDRGQGLTKRTLQFALDREVAQLDRYINDQVNTIIHHPKFKRLEASWRGLSYLCGQAESCDGVKIKALSVSWTELTKDQDRAIEFDQSAMFHKIYSQEFGTAGGEPFGALIGDYTVRHRRSADHKEDDIDTLRGLSQVAAASFSPFVAAADPVLFGLDNYRQLNRHLNLDSSFQQVEYVKWRSFRDSDDSRFVGLVMPKVLMRLPYEDISIRTDGFRFKEKVKFPNHDHYLWGNAVYAYASVLVRSMGEYGWPADIRGVREGEIGGGLGEGLPASPFLTDSKVASRYATDTLISDLMEKELSDFGFISLCQMKQEQYCAFYATPSVQKPKIYDRQEANVNAKLSSALQYMLCVSRFAQYLKVLVRDKIGSFTSPEECEAFLQRWILQYCTANEDLSPELKARFPLRDAKVSVRASKGKPGVYLCVAHLRPHFQLESISTAIRVVTEFNPIVS